MESLNKLNVTLKNLITKYVPPVNLKVLQVAYKLQEGCELPYTEYGYSDAAAFLQENFPELVFEEGTKGMDLYCVGVKEAPNGSRSPASDNGTNFGSPFQLSNGRSYNRTKVVPFKFRQFLSKIIDQYPTGISAREFVSAFGRTSGSPLSFEMYGYRGHVSMFKDLSDVFRVDVDANGEHLLFPASGRMPTAERSDSAEKENKFKLVKTPRKEVLTPGRALNENGTLQRKTLGADIQPIVRTPARASAEKGSSSNGPKAELNGCGDSVVQRPVKKVRTNLGNLFIVRLNDELFVPSASLAVLAGQKSDNVIEQLNLKGVHLKNLKFLTQEVIEHEKLRMQIVLAGCPLVISDEGSIVKVISLIPLSSCAPILGVFLAPSSVSSSTKIDDLVQALKEIIVFFAQTKNSTRSLGHDNASPPRL